VLIKTGQKRSKANMRFLHWHVYSSSKGLLIIRDEFRVEKSDLEFNPGHTPMDWEFGAGGGFLLSDPIYVTIYPD